MNKTPDSGIEPATGFDQFLQMHPHCRARAALEMRDTASMRFAKSLTPRVTFDFGERTRPRVRGSAPSLNPLPDVSDAGVADHTRGRVCSPKTMPIVVVPRCSRSEEIGIYLIDKFDGRGDADTRRGQTNDARNREAAPLSGCEQNK